MKELLFGFVDNLVSLLVAILKKPRILIEPDLYKDQPGPEEATYVGVRVSNPGRLLLARDPISSCRVELQFSDKDECPVSCPDDFPQGFIEGRWDSTMNPDGYFRENNNSLRWVSRYIDHDTSIESSLRQTRKAKKARIDTTDNPRSRRVRVAALTPKGDYFVWSDKMVAYLERQMDPLPERDRLKLTMPEYVVTVQVTTGGGKERREKFILYTPNGGEGFRLEPFAG